MKFNQLICKYSIPFFLIYTATFISLTIISGIVNYTPLPFWDTLNMADFIYEDYKTLNGWWGQYNEHRIILGKGLFLLNNLLYGESIKFLVIFNYILLGVVLLSFIAIIHNTFPEEDKRNIRIYLSCIVATFTFSLVQAENLYWEFQAQFSGFNLESKKKIIFERMIAGLSIALKIRDYDQIKNIFPMPEIIFQNLEKYKGEKNYVLAIPELRDAHMLMGKMYDGKPVNACEGNVDGVGIVSNDKKYSKVNGWIYDPIEKEAPKTVLIVSENKIIGYALTGRPRKDVSNIVGWRAKYSGFQGYLLTSYVNNPSLTLIGRDPQCELQWN